MGAAAHDLQLDPSQLLSKRTILYLGLGGITNMKWIQALLPRLEYVLFAALFWSISANGPKLLNFDGDLPRHILLGRLIRETRRVPLIDTFSFRTEGFPAIPHEWLSQVLFSIANDGMGLSGVVLLTALIVTATWAIVYREADRRANNLAFSLMITALGIAASMIHVLPRPHLFTYLLTAFWIVILERINSDKPNLWWLLPLLMVLWVNMHGMFVLGIAIWSIYLLGSFLEDPTRLWFSKPLTRSMLLGGMLSTLATLLSPSGIQIWESIVSLGSNSYITSRIPEYQSANFHTPETWPFLLLLLLTMIGFARSTTRPSWIHTLLAASFAAIAIYTSRMIPLFAIVAVPLVSKSLSDWIRHEYPGSRFSAIEKNLSKINSSANGSVWLLVVIIAVALIFNTGKSIDPRGKVNRFDSEFFPVVAVTWLNSHPQQGHMFNEFDWGGYLLLYLVPRPQIFMDGHTHIYGEALTREYETLVTLGKDWQQIFEKYQIKWAILRTKSPIAQVLEEIGWTVIYRDQTATVLKK
jgi:hypothetical protein